MKAYGRWPWFETSFFVVSAYKIMVLILDIWLYEVNVLFYCLALNSGLIICISYKLRSRMLKAMGATGRSRIAKGRFWLRMGILVLIMVVPVFDLFDNGTNFLSCKTRLYRK
jgi:hypothetical protein